MEEVIKLLINSKLKEVEKVTGIPYARMYKWTIGAGKPKITDFELLKKYFNIGQSSINYSEPEDKADRFLHERETELNYTATKKVERKPDPASKIDQIKEIVKLRDKGDITKEQSEKLISDIINN